MTFDWYLIFNLNDFNALGLESKAYNVYLEGLGLKAILVTKGVGVSVVVDDKFLPIEFNDNNPWIDEGKAVYLDEDDNVWIGYEIEE
jgi:hypothetical protein